MAGSDRGALEKQREIRILSVAGDCDEEELRFWRGGEKVCLVGSFGFEQVEVGAGASWRWAAVGGGGLQWGLGEILESTCFWTVPSISINLSLSPTPRPET